MAMPPPKTKLAFFLLALACGPPAADACLDFFSQQLRILIKRFIYGGLTTVRSSEIAAGTAAPLVRFDWEDAVFVHWRILPDAVAGLEEEVLSSSLDETAGLSIAPVQVLLLDNVTAPAAPVLSLCVRRVGDAVQLDFLTYVRTEQDPKPKLLVVESRSTVDLLTPLGPVAAVAIDLEVSDGTVTFGVDEADSRRVGPYSINTANGQQQNLDREFLQAFDRLYYPNGIYTQLFLDRSLYQAQPAVRSGTDLPTGGFDAFLPRWATYIESDPFCAVYFPETISFGAELWTNTEEIDSGLVASRSSLYDETEALDIFVGTAQPIATFTVSPEVPSYFVGFKILQDKMDDLTQYLGLPESFQLAPIRLRENGPKDLMLVLNVYKGIITGISEGLRAEWSVFIRPDDESDVRILVVEAVTDSGSFDPVDLFTGAAKSFEHKDEGGTTATSYAVSGGLLQDDIGFSLSYPTPGACVENDPTRDFCDVMTVDFLVANDEIYWKNGIYERGLYNDILGIPLRVVDPSDFTFDISQSGWAPFVESEVLDFFVFNPVELQYFLQPMYNVEEIGCTLCDYFSFLCF